MGDNDNFLAAAAAIQSAQPQQQGAPLRPAQIDGNQTTAPPRPTNAPLQDRRSSPGEYNSSGMERAMHAHANRVHPVRKR